VLFGPSGSGKTTILRAIAGLVSPQAGRIAAGKTVLFDAAAGINVPVRQRQVGFVFQHLALFPHLTVSENVEYGLHGDRPRTRAARAASILESFRVAHLARRRPGEISGGERQRVALARSLVTSPRVLLLDEPLAALDYATQTRIIDDLRGWNARRGIPILYVTHAHREAFALGDSMIAIERGSIQATGLPHDVLEAPARESVARGAGFENFFDATVMSVRPDWGTMSCRLDDSGTEIEVPASGAEPGAPVRLAVRAGDIIVAGEAPRALSARNVLEGTLTAIRREGPTVVARVTAHAEGARGATFEVHVTPGASETLGLQEGRLVWLVVKTHSWRVII
jgi:molybdate transport system ATP-binding protein